MTISAWNCAVAWVNLADLGSITVAGALLRAPASNLQNKHVMRKCRVNATSMAIVCDLGSVKSLDTIALMGMAGTAPTLRVRVSTSDSSGEAGDVYDSGSLSGAWDSNYLPFVHLLASPVSGRYVRTDSSEAGVDYTEAGRLFIGVRQQFATNFQPGWARQNNDLSPSKVGRHGQTFHDVLDSYRTVSLNFEVMSEDNRWDIVEAIDLALGAHGDFLLMTDPSSDNLSRDSLWGYLDGIDPVLQPMLFDENGPCFTRGYKVRERL